LNRAGLLDAGLSRQHYRWFFGIVISIPMNAALKSRIAHGGWRHPHKALLEAMKRQLAFVVQVGLAHDRPAMGADRLRGQSQALTRLCVVRAIANH